MQSVFDTSVVLSANERTPRVLLSHGMNTGFATPHEVVHERVRPRHGYICLLRTSPTNPCVDGLCLSAKFGLANNFH